MDYIKITGQFLGFVAVVLGFISYQVKSAKSILILQTLTCVVFSAHYLLIDAISAFVLNAVGIVRNIIYFHKDKKIFSYRFYPFAFAVIVFVLGILSWQNIYSLLITVGLVINTLGLSFKNPQNIRKSILVSSPIVLLYDILVMSIGGAIYESVAIISAAVGLVRYIRKGKSV